MFIFDDQMFIGYSVCTYSIYITVLKLFGVSDLWESEIWCRNTTVSPKNVAKESKLRVYGLSSSSMRHSHTLSLMLNIPDLEHDTNRRVSAHGDTIAAIRILFSRKLHHTSVERETRCMMLMNTDWI